jgi:hypothetical protein
LNASYAQAVQLLQARQYQQALEQWAQVQALDPAYPDRQKVQATAKKKLKELTQVSSTKGGLPRWALAALGLLGVLVVILILTYPDWGKRLTQQDGTALPVAAVPATSDTGSLTGAVPSQTAELAALPGIPDPTRTPRPTSILTVVSTRSAKMAAATRKPTPTSTIGFPIVDDFNNPQYEGSYNPELWSVSTDVTDIIFQQDGAMMFSCNTSVENPNLTLNFLAIEDIPLSKPYSLEAQFMVDEASAGVGFGPKIFIPKAIVGCNVNAWWGEQNICCFNYLFENFNQLPCKTITPGSWHWIRIDLLGSNEFDFYVDREFFGTMRLPITGSPWLTYNIFLGYETCREKSNKGYIDDFSFGPLPTP